MADPSQSCYGTDVSSARLSVRSSESEENSNSPMEAGSDLEGGSDIVGSDYDNEEAIAAAYTGD